MILNLNPIIRFKPDTSFDIDSRLHHHLKQAKNRGQIDMNSIRQAPMPSFTFAGRKSKAKTQVRHPQSNPELAANELANRQSTKPPKRHFECSIGCCCGILVAISDFLHGRKDEVREHRMEMQAQFYPERTSEEDVENRSPRKLAIPKKLSPENLKRPQFFPTATAPTLKTMEIKPATEIKSDILGSKEKLRRTYSD
jgi:hypothetical protein